MVFWTVPFLVDQVLELALPDQELKKKWATLYSLCPSIISDGKGGVIGFNGCWGATGTIKEQQNTGWIYNIGGNCRQYATGLICDRKLANKSGIQFLRWPLTVDGIVDQVWDHGLGVNTSALNGLGGTYT